MSEVFISPEYQDEQRRMHREMQEYGVECLNYVDTIAKIIVERDLHSMLDYGAGKGRIVPALTDEFDKYEHIPRPFSIELYDPGVPQWSERPDPAELVTCIDVLEHVEPQYTIGVLHDLHRCTEKVAFITIGMKPASKVLSDGRNAHINLRSSQEWMTLLLRHFKMIYAADRGRSLLFLGKPIVSEVLT